MKILDMTGGNHWFAVFFLSLLVGLSLSISACDPEDPEYLTTSVIDCRSSTVSCADSYSCLEDDQGIFLCRSLASNAPVGGTIIQGMPAGTTDVSIAGMNDGFAEITEVAAGEAGSRSAEPVASDLPSSPSPMVEPPPMENDNGGAMDSLSEMMGGMGLGETSDPSMPSGASQDTIPIGGFDGQATMPLGGQPDPESANSRGGIVAQADEGGADQPIAAGTATIEIGGGQSGGLDLGRTEFAGMIDDLAGNTAPEAGHGNGDMLSDDDLVILFGGTGGEGAGGQPVGGLVAGTMGDGSGGGVSASHLSAGGGGTGGYDSDWEIGGVVAGVEAFPGGRLNTDGDSNGAGGLD